MIKMEVSVAMKHIDPTLNVTTTAPPDGQLGLALDVEGELAGENAHILRHAVEPVFITPTTPHLTLNMHGVKYMDSTGIGVLVSIIQKISDRDGRLVIVGLNETGQQLLRILQLAGLDCVSVQAS